MKKFLFITATLDSRFDSRQRNYIKIFIDIKVILLHAYQILHGVNVEMGQVPQELPQLGIAAVQVPFTAVVVVVVITRVT